MDVRVALAGVLVVFLAGSCSASYITMGVTVTPPEVVAEDVFQLKVTVLNSGDEEAHDVQLSLSLPEGFSSEPVYVGVLPPGRPYEHTFDVSIEDFVKYGTYPAMVKTHYADANAYPFSTISPTFIRYKQPTPFQIRGNVGEVSLVAGSEKDKELVLEVSNLDDKPHKILVKFHLPDELKAGFYSTELELNERDAGKVTVPLRSFGALAGSTYVVFASMEYEDGGLHYSATSGGIVRIVAQEAEEKGDGTSWIPAAVIAALVAALVYYQVKR
ncbi:MAG: NEW3 domain-containing protein [Candidatus Altiarchaeota archaeon]